MPKGLKGFQKGILNPSKIKSPWNKGKKGVVSYEARIKMGSSNRGIPCTEERRRKLSIKLKGRKHSAEHCKNLSLSKKGHIPWNKGLKGVQSWSLESRRKSSESHKGAKAYQWKGGITEKNLIIRKSLEYRLWRTAVFERDNYTCVWCGDNQGHNLNADHIKRFSEFPELRFAIDNGRTLCKPCHRTTDTWGSTGMKREYKPRNSRMKKV